MYILIIKVIFQEVPMRKTCLINVQEGWEPKKYLRECCYHRIECLAANFLTAFMRRRFLNNAALATTTNRRSERVSDGTGTRVVTQIINRRRIKIIQRDLYNVRGPPLIGDQKNREKNHCSNQNCISNLFI